MNGSEVKVKGSSNQIMIWKVIANQKPDCNAILEEKESSLVGGLKDFNSNDYVHSSIFAQLFLKLAIKDWKARVQLLNLTITTSKAHVDKFTYSECLVDLGITISLAESLRSQVERINQETIRRIQTWLP
jgi:hypothetical protein